MRLTKVKKKKPSLMQIIVDDIFIYGACYMNSKGERVDPEVAVKAIRDGKVKLRRI